MRTVRLIPLAFAIAALGACERAPDKPINNSSHPSNAADNTKTNERDRDNATLTPLDQGEGEADRAITQKVRQEVVKDDTLSVTAKNVKIITVNGVVTLRGPVTNDRERIAVGALAQRVAGIKQVDNQLEVAAN